MNLGIDEVRFWDMTPAETEAVHLNLIRQAEVSRQKDESDWNRAGLVAAILTNIHSKRGARTVMIDDFNPYKDHKSDQPTQEEIDGMFNHWKRFETKE